MSLYFKPVSIALTLITCLLLTPVTAQAEITITKAWLRTNIGDRPSAGYFELHNQGAADKLIGARSEAFGHIELHTHIMEGEIMRMRKIETVTLAPNSKTSFQPHGYHLMLFKPKTALEKGASVEVTLLFENNQSQKINFNIGAMGKHHKKPAAHHHHGH